MINIFLIIMGIERAIDVHISLYPEQINNVKIYAEHKRFKSISQAYQFIIDRFFEDDDNKKDVILFFFVPLLFVFLTTIVNLSTGRVYDILIRDGVFFDELMVLSRVFMLMSFGSIGILCACVYWLYVKRRDQKVFKGGLNGD